MKIFAICLIALSFGINASDDYHPGKTLLLKLKRTNSDWIKPYALKAKNGDSAARDHLFENAILALDYVEHFPTFIPEMSSSLKYEMVNSFYPLLSELTQLTSTERSLVNSMKFRIRNLPGVEEKSVLISKGNSAPTYKVTLVSGGRSTHRTVEDLLASLDIPDIENGLPKDPKNQIPEKIQIPGDILPNIDPTNPNISLEQLQKAAKGPQDLKQLERQFQKSSGRLNPEPSLVNPTRYRMNSSGSMGSGSKSNTTTTTNSGNGP